MQLQPLSKRKGEGTGRNCVAMTYDALGDRLQMDHPSRETSPTSFGLLASPSTSFREKWQKMDILGKQRHLHKVFTQTHGRLKSEFSLAGWFCISMPVSIAAQRHMKHMSYDQTWYQNGPHPFVAGIVPYKASLPGF